MRLLVQPADGVAPILQAIAHARKSIEVAIFRFDRADIEIALKAAAARGVQVTALIAFQNRGGEKKLRELELRFLDAGMRVSRTADDLVRYHGKYILIDRRLLLVLSFNFTRLDIKHSRGFGIIASGPTLLQEARTLFKADCMRRKYAPKVPTFVVSPANSRKTLGAFLRRAKTQLLVYDPGISDQEMLRILHERTASGVEVKVIGKVAGRHRFASQKLSGMRLHTRTIIRDRKQAFIGSQSLNPAELDARREVGLIVQQPTIIRKLIETFEADWTEQAAKTKPGAATKGAAPKNDAPAVTRKDAAKAVGLLTKELQPLAAAVKKAVRQAVSKAGDDVLHDKDVKDTMKQVVKRAVKEAVKDAVHDAH